MATVRIEDWSVIRANSDPYLAPERAGIKIHGAVYGHPAYADGSYIATSDVIGSTGRTVHCVSRNYELGSPSSSFLAWLAGEGLTYDPVQPVKIS